MGFISRKHPRRTRAQSLVEFALVLPVLLLIIYGLLEAGRLIFIYSMVTTASREAARYGSATGLNVLGGTPQYQNCAGIRAAAQVADFINVINDANITIQYDHGPLSGGTGPIAGYPAPFATCVNTYAGPVPSTGDRIVVQVTSSYTTLFKIVPLGPLTVRSSNARTILASLAVAGTSLPPPTLPPPTPTFTPTLTPTATNTPTLVYTPTFTSSPTNTVSPTNTATPTLTFTPSNTPTNTATATQTPTPVNCTLLRHSTISTPNNTMVMEINNPTGAPLIVTQIYLQWNYANGHTLPASPPVGSTTLLRLTNISLAGVTILSGSYAGPTQVLAFVPAAGITLPSGISSIVFTFDQSYDNESGELIQLQFANNGCQSYTLSSSTPSVWP